MGHHSWRALDRAIQRDVENAKGQSTEAHEKALKRANHYYATVGGAQAGVLAGGVIGTIVPVVGTIVGAVIGGIVGGLWGHNATKD